MSGIPPADAARLQEAPGNPYAAPDTASQDMPSDAEIADAVSVHDRYPLLARAVGPYFGHYARRWHLREGGGRSRPWHWPALFFDIYWLMYRKLYLLAFVYLGLSFVAGAVIALLPAYETPAVVAVLLLKVALCVSANALCRWHCNRLVARMQARYADQPERMQAEIGRRGGTSALGLILAIVIMGAISLLAEA